jgi:hypothetical protein
MYFFVRFTGIMIIILGVLLILVGLGGAIYGLAQNDVILGMVNTSLAATGSNLRLVDSRPYAAIFGLLMFMAGMSIGAIGQLLLVFADVAKNTKETNILLRGMRKVELVAPVKTPREAQLEPVEYFPAVKAPHQAAGQAPKINLDLDDQPRG